MQHSSGFSSCILREFGSWTAAFSSGKWNFPISSVHSHRLTSKASVTGTEYLQNHPSGRSFRPRRIGTGMSFTRQVRWACRWAVAPSSTTSDYSAHVRATSVGRRSCCMRWAAPSPRVSRHFNSQGRCNGRREGRLLLPK